MKSLTQTLFVTNFLLAATFALGVEEELATVEVLPPEHRHSLPVSIATKIHNARAKRKLQAISPAAESLAPVEVLQPESDPSIKRQRD